MSNAHKEEERESFESFRVAWSGGSVIATVEYDDRPDVRCTLVGGKGLGVEIVRLVDPDDAARDRQIRNWFMGDLEIAFQQKGVSGGVSVDLLADGVKRLSNRTSRAQLVDAIAEIARKGIPPGGLSRAELQQPMFEGVDRLAVFPRLTGPAVSVTGSLRDRGEGELRACIAEKDADAVRYRSNLGADADLWLLVVTGTLLGGAIEAPQNITFETFYDRVFLFDNDKLFSGEFLGLVTDLPIRCRSTAPAA